MIKAVVSGVILAGLTVNGAENVASADTFKVGFNRIDITPPLGTPISGYYNRRIADGVLDPLYARCLALSDGESRALVYSVDNLHITDAVIDEIKAEITRKTSVPAEAIFIACSHTHTGPSTALSGSVNTLPEDEDTIRFSNRILASRCADAGVRALEDLAPAKILLGRGEAKNISFIRRFRMKDGTTRTNPGTNNPDVECALGEPDEQVQLVRFVRDGKKEVALINFQCHPDVVSGTKFSADWPGLACTYLENAMGNEIEALLINGAQGDTNHLRPKTA
ncbi:MAG TPA: neutral/alkaline non-lysosomal ceramidase N-terminal domain-containing protein, partial [Candidatus Latescibacteria bacterium]|nr:neutral/alkaline non-lysosomal ceramidase N-terminal domain-containing protein [Candidatus Latescibacterota bacterium]